jgi:TfoX/Sxy family transcriptional regulator of competence genes
VNGPWPKASPQLADQFRELAAGLEGVDVRKMFGFPAGFVNGNMAIGMFGDTYLVRLPEERRTERLAAGWSLFEPMPGRPMREYVALPPEVAADPEAARPWLALAATHVATLPPKQPKPRKRA